MIEGREEKQHKYEKERGRDKEEAARRIINGGKRERKAAERGTTLTVKALPSGSCYDNTSSSD